MNANEDDARTEDPGGQGTDGGGTDGGGRRRPPGVAWFALVAVLGVAAGAGAVFLAGGFRDMAAARGCAAAAETAAALEPLATGPLAAFEPLSAPVDLSTLAFRDGSGARLTLADFSGRTVLFNLWATWCAPCRAEMPSLDRLQERLGGPGFEVVAVSIDTKDDAPTRAFLEETGADDLAYYRDRTMAIFNTLRDAGLAYGMPTTLLVDGAGCGVGVLHGAAEWDAPAAVRMVETVMAAGED